MLFHRLFASSSRVRAYALIAPVWLVGAAALGTPTVASGAVTSLTAGQGISLSPNPITSTGTISLSLPLTLSVTEPSAIFSLTNSSTSPDAGAIIANGRQFGVAGTGGAGGQGILGNGADGIDAEAGKVVGALAGKFTGGVRVTGTLAAGRLLSPLAWQTLTLQSNWKGGPFGTAVPAVALDGQGIVHLRGGMQSTGKFGALAFTLPAAFRPSHTEFVVVDTVNATTGRLQIDADGSVLVQDTASGANAANFTSLDGVTYSLG